MKQNVIFEVKGYELRVKKKETLGGLEMKPKIAKMHYSSLVKEIQDIVSQNDGLAVIEGIEGGEELVNLIKERINIIRKIDGVAFELLANIEDEKK